MKNKVLLDKTKKLFETSIYGAYVITFANLWPLINLIAIERFLETNKLTKKQQLAIIEFMKDQNYLCAFRNFLDNFHIICSKKGRKEIVKIFTKKEKKNK